MTLKINIYNLIVCRAYKKCERSESLSTLFKSQIICTDDNACENIQISNETCVSHSCLQAERTGHFNLVPRRSGNRKCNMCSLYRLFLHQLCHRTERSQVAGRLWEQGERACGMKRWHSCFPLPQSRQGTYDYAWAPLAKAIHMPHLNARVVRNIVKQLNYLLGKIDLVSPCHFLQNVHYFMSSYKLLDLNFSLGSHTRI